MSRHTGSPDVLSLVLTGGDERTSLRADTGANRYHLNPVEHHRLFSRGSCTAGTLNPDTESALRARADVLLGGDFASLLRDHEVRLKRLLSYAGEDKFDIIFAPSGSDLAYLPILITSILNPGVPIKSFVTCPEELGSGTNVACSARYFMRQTQFGRQVEPKVPLNDRLEIDVVRYPARSESGHIVDHRKDLEEAIHAHRHHPRIGNLVMGSKSGIEDNLTLVPSTDEDVLWSVDLCQFRNNKRLVNVLLDMGCLVMITGSKFYQAPPFCGAMLVPRRITRRLQDARVDPGTTSGFDQVFSAYDFGTGLENLRPHFPVFENRGLAARWECALLEMELFDRLPADTTRDLVGDWNRFIMGLLEAHEAFQPMPQQERTNQSIISFKVRAGDRFLGEEELGRLFAALSGSPVHGMNGYERVFFGQPVAYGDRAFIRLALGAYNIRKLLESPAETRFDNDRALIMLIAEAGAQVA